MGEPPPAALEIPVARPAALPGLRGPVAFIHPTLDGRPTHFYEWQQAGHLVSAGGGTAMHAGRGLASDLYYGFDRECLYLRVDFVAGEPPGGGHALRLDWIEPTASRMEVRSLSCGAHDLLRIVPDGGGVLVAGAECRIDTVIELAIPLDALAAAPGQPIECLVQLLEGGRPNEAVPPGDSLRAQVPDDSFDVESWIP